MTFCDALKAAIDNRQAERWSSTVVEAEFPNSCRVRLDECEIQFLFDDRDELVSSSILFFSVPEKYQDVMETYVLFRLFDLEWNHGSKALSIEEKTNLEIDQVEQLLNCIESDEISPVSLFYFFTGYNRAYTDSMSDVR